MSNVRALSRTAHPPGHIQIIDSIALACDAATLRVRLIWLDLIRDVFGHKLVSRKATGMTDRTASIYKRDGKFVICANARVKDGYLIDHEPFVLLQEPVSAMDLGKAVTEALAQYRTDVEAPPSSQEFFSFFAQLAGVETYREFMSGARYCNVEQIGDVIEFRPMRNDGEEFGALEEASIEIPRTSNHEAIGRAASAGIGKAR